MRTLYTDTDLTQKIESLKSKIQTWAESHDLWHDCGFKSWQEHMQDEPRENPVVLLLWAEGPLYNVLNMYEDGELYEELADLVEKQGFFMELWDHITAQFTVQDNNDNLTEAFRDYFEWQWILTMIQPDYEDLHAEIYSHIAKDPSRLHQLSPRQFEAFLDAVFRNNGYRTELGSGGGDGGVDIRIYANDVVGEVATLVQAKRYAGNRPIHLQAVQALAACVEDERANRGLFVTTSRYLPGVEKFAERHKARLTLATSSEVALWCETAKRRIIRDLSQLTSTAHIANVFSGKSNRGLEGKIFVARTGYNTINNEFAIVLRETKNVTLLMKLDKSVVTHDGYGQRGLHTAAKHPKPRTEKLFFRAQKRDDTDGTLWGDLHLYSPWDGQPRHFDHCD